MGVQGKGGAREGSVKPSRYLQLALLAVVAVHALAFELQDLDNGHHALGDSEYFAGNGNYAASSVMPQQVVPLRFTKTSKKECAKACDEEGKCVGFKYGGEGCTLMQNRPVEQRGTPERMKTLPKNQSRKLKKAAGARLKFVPNKQAAVATAVLEAEVGRMSNNKLRQVESVAEEEEGFHLKAARRNPRRAAPRARKVLTLIARYNLKTKAMKLQIANLPKATEKRIQSTLQKMPGNSKPGSQQRKANHLWRQAKSDMRQYVKTEIKKFKKNKLKKLQKRMFKEMGADFVMRDLHKQLRKARANWRKVRAWRMDPSKLGNDAIVSSTESEKADNLPNCAEMRPMCQSDIRVRRQCPHTCKFLQEEKQEKLDKVVEAEKVIAKREENRAARERKIANKYSARLEHVRAQNAKEKESEEKLRVKKRKLEKKLGIHPEKLKVKFAGTPAEERQHKLDIKAKALTAKATQLRKDATKKIVAGQKVIAKEGATSDKQKKAIAKARILTPVVEIVNGKPKTVQPDQAGNIAKAKADGKKVQAALSTAVSDIKTGENELKQSKILFKQAAAVANAKPPMKKKAAKPPSANTQAVQKYGKELVALEKKAKNASKDEKVTLSKKAEHLKKKIGELMKPQFELGESMSAKVAKVFDSLTSPERFITFDKENQCNYNPPAGCGCSGVIQTQQPDPRGGSRRLLADPVNKGACPAMPADCRCEEELDEVSLLQVLDGLSDMERSSMFKGIICRVRTAVVLAQKNDPSLLSHVEKGAVFQKNKKTLGPLLSCVKDSANEDKACEPYLFGLLGSMNDVMPEVKNLQTKLGVSYQRAVKKKCAAPS